ncbi:MAG: hypothetical protein KDA29_06705 [Phycisphaerales bacterium]|nr:hypothetical protein [Phycisphaerales bacterium]
MNTKANNPITLGIEMSNPSAARDEQSRPHSVAMWNSEGELLGSAPLPASARGSDAVMHAIASLGDQVGVSASSIGRVLVSVGPGGYTALRIATTSAKMLAHTLGASLVAVPSARVASIRIEPGLCPALVALASKKNRSHATVIEADGSMREVGIIDAEALASMGVRSIVSDHHLPASFAEMAGSLGIQIVPLVLDARDLLLACEGIGDCDPLLLAPLYAREPDAVTQWRARGS